MDGEELATVSPPTRQPGLRAAFSPKKEERVFLAQGVYTFTLPGRTSSVTVSVKCAGSTDEEAMDADKVSINVYWDEEQRRPAVGLFKVDRIVETSLHGLVDEQRVARQLAWQLLLYDALNHERATWAALYCFWIRHKRFDRLPILCDGQSSDARVRDYLLQSGLGLTSPTESDVVLLDRNAFWQGAGAPNELHWLRSPVPVRGVFPHTLSFTRTASPPVVTTHPLRPPKPEPGTVVYSRYIFSCHQHLELVHIDPASPAHFEAYCRWQNSDRVHHGWRERGPAQKHREYLEAKAADPHGMGVLVTWDGVPAGYGEMVWSKEDPMAPYVGGLGDYDQGTHLLIGEEAYRGKHRFTACMVSLKHACFLRDPRTEIVVGEPRYDLHIVPLLATFLPQEIRREVELPHKRAVFFVLRRDRFFDEAILE
ncbi:Acyltransferase fer5 [Thecaphora frezii]